MNLAQVISVNPSVKTLGELSAPSEKYMSGISRALSNPEKRVSSLFVGMVNMISGINSKTNKQLSYKVLYIRLIIGLMLIAFSINPMVSQPVSALSVTTVLTFLLGCTIIAGFLTRPATIGAALFFSTMFIQSISSGSVDNMSGLMMVMMLVISIMGPGMFSLDRIIRRNLLSMRGKIQTKKFNSRYNGTSVYYTAYADIEKRTKFNY